MAYISQSLPISIRAHLLTAFVIYSDSSVPFLLKQLLSSPSPNVRRLAALGCGALCDQKAVNALIDLLTDNIPDVRHAACLALGAINNAFSTSAVVDPLIEGDENLQQCTAEVLAGKQVEGYQIFKEALSMDNLLVRRAVVIGLSRNREEWSNSLLERITIEDGRWVV